MIHTRYPPPGHVRFELDGSNYAATVMPKGDDK
jgi:hypothetical protein